MKNSTVIFMLRWIGVVALPIPVYIAFNLLCYLFSQVISLCSRLPIMDRVVGDLTIYYLIARATSAALTIEFVSYIAPSYKVICACLWGGAMSMLFIIGLILGWGAMDISTRITTIAPLIGCGFGIYMVLQSSEEKRP